MANFVQSFFDINAPAAYDVEEISNGGGLRLRCRPSHATSLRPAWVMDGNQAVTGAVNFNPIYWLRDLVEHRRMTPERCQTVTYNRFGGDSLAVINRSVLAGIRQADVCDLFAGSWTLDMEIASTNWNNAGMLANLRAVVADPANMVFDVAWNGGGVKTFTINFYSGVATVYTATLDASAWTFTNLKYYDLRITFNRVAQLYKAELRDPATDARVTVTRNGVAAVNSPTGFDQPPLVLGGYPNDAGANGTTLAGTAPSICIQRAYLYTSFLDTGLFAIAARPTFYAATTAGDADGVSAVCTIDSGADDSSFDPSTLLASDESTMAAAVGAGGWEFRYQITNDAVPSAWSAWMTWATLKTEAAADGRYLHLGMRATSDGYNDFYRLDWILIQADVYALPTTPVLSNLLRDEAVGSVVTTGDADSTIEIWAASLFDEVGSIIWEKIGERVGPGAVVLDFSLFTWTLGALVVVNPAKLIAVAINPAGAYSAMSNVLGYSFGDSTPVTIAGAAISPAGTLTFTVAGLVDPDDIIVWFAYVAGVLVATVTTGNGPQTWAGGFDPNVNNSFTGIPQDRYGHTLLMPLAIHVAGAGGAVPYCRPRQAPGIEERNP